MDTQTIAGGKSTYTFPASWWRTYPSKEFDLLPTDALAQESGAWDRYVKDTSRFACHKDVWKERLGGLRFQDVDLSYLKYLATIRDEQGGLIRMAVDVRAWFETPDGLTYLKDYPFRRRSAQFAANSAERESDVGTSTGAEDGFILGDGDSGFCPTLDETDPPKGTSWYSGVEWIQPKRTADFDPSPWVVTGMAVRSHQDLKFKGENLIPLERGAGDWDWDPAPWQTYGFLRYMRNAGMKGWLHIRKSGRHVEMNETEGKLGTPSRKVSWKSAIECMVETTIERAVRSQFTGLITKTKKMSLSRTLELPGEWMVDNTGPEPVFINRHLWDAVTAAGVAMRSLLQALTERGLTSFSEAEDPRMACCLYAADLYASMPTEKECEKDLPLLKWRACVGKVADMVVTRAAELADDAARPKVDPNTWDGTTYELWIVRMAEMLIGCRLRDIGRPENKELVPALHKHTIAVEASRLRRKRIANTITPTKIGRDFACFGPIDRAGEGVGDVLLNDEVVTLKSRLAK